MSRLLEELPPELSNSMKLDDKLLLKKTSDALDFLESALCKQGLDSGFSSSGECMFKKGYDSQLDESFKQMKDRRAGMEAYRKTFSDLIDESASMIKLDNTDKDGWFLSTTKKRAEALKQALKKKEGVLIATKQVSQEDIILSNTTSACRVSTQEFKTMADQLVSLIDDAKSRTSEIFGKFSSDFTIRFGGDLQYLCDVIIEIDLCACAAAVADKRRYCRPKISRHETEKGSFIRAKDIRHAIIECLQTGLQYVPASISLGKENETSADDDLAFTNMQDMNGMLLYGCNSAGKSSLMKAVGLSIVLAQAGFYVPAKEFRFRPFNSVMTRILGNDDIFKGHSSFATEMSELCGILKRADNRTMVLGDEIANSTESTSGLAIVAAAVDRLSKQESKFIFATHLHELSKLHCIQSLKNVRHFHLEIRYDASLDALVYDRCLKEGSGSAIYGLEIAKSDGDG